MEIEFYERFLEPVSETVTMDNDKYPVDYDYHHSIKNHLSEVLAHSDDGNPVFFKKKYGKGMIYLLTVPVESYLSVRHREFNDRNTPDYSDFCKKFAGEKGNRNIVSVNDRYVLITEHFVSDNEAYVTVVNYGREK